MEHSRIDELARVLLRRCRDDCTPENCDRMALIYGFMLAEECSSAQLAHDRVDPVGQG